jgi:hypothetical protein
LIFFKDAKNYLRWGNSADVAEVAEINRRERAWQLSWRRYWEHLDKIADRLGPKAYNFFRFCHNDASLHDGYLLSFNLGDSIGLSEASYSRLRFGEGPSTIAMAILNHEKTRLHQFVFKGPRKIVVDIPSDDPMFFARDKSLVQINLYEIRSATPKYLSVEWLLDSGGTLLIEFEKLGYGCKRIKVPEKKKVRSKRS